MGPMKKHGGTNFQKPKDMKGTFVRLFRYMKPYQVGLICVILFTLLATGLTAMGPKILGWSTNTIMDGFFAMNAGTGGIDFTRLFYILALLATVYVLAALFNYLQQFLMAGVSQKTMYDLRKAVDLKIKKLPLNYFDSNSYGDILSRVTNDVDTVSNSLQQSISQVISSVATLVAILVIMLTTSVSLTVVGLITIPLSLWFTMVIVKRSQKNFRGQQKSMGDLNGHVEEMYNGHKVIKAYSQEQDVIDKFEEINDNLYNYGWKAQFVSSIMMPVNKFCGNLGYVFVCILGSVQVVSGKVQVGTIQSFIQYIRQFNQPITQISNIANMLQSTAAAAERIFEFLDAEEEIPDPVSPKDYSEIEGDVVFNHVKFGYSPDKILIKDLNISIPHDAKVAIVGPTGAGKTTLVNLLLRFYDVNDGSIKIDGIDVRDMSRIRLREIFGMVLQDTWLFKGTIMENIRYGRLNATDEEVKEAARMAHCDSFIRTLPGTYQFELNEDATNISQGERQLVTIARAILANPPIMILDEATSSVDTRTEVLIQKAMNNLMKSRTSFVIAHRLSTIRDSDLILVMRNGDIVETGNHEELLEKKGFYADLYNSQFAENNAR